MRAHNLISKTSLEYNMERNTTLFERFTDMELQRLHHAMMEMVYLRELDDPTRQDLLEWMRNEMQVRMQEEEE